jgi:uncharacterized protein YdeI (YjbR/CyaY-like superfamily)
MDAAVDAYFERAKTWHDEMMKLRMIALDMGFSEGLKWGEPCFTLDDRNIFLIHRFKDYCAILFFKGVLMKDPEGVLIQQTENVQAARQIRFATLAQIETMEPVLRAYIAEAIAIEKSGAKVPMKETADFEMPEEFLRALEENPPLQSAFESLTPGRQRAYLLHFAEPKLAKTREARIEKHSPRILAGKGIMDK